jgi:hypothetical protein
MAFSPKPTLPCQHQLLCQPLKQAACSTSMANPHNICMLLNNTMTYLGIKQWHESSQPHPTIPFILMKDTNEAIVQIAQNGKLPCKTCHIKQPFCHVCQNRQDSIHQLHWNLVHHNLLTSSNKNKQTKHKSHPKLIFTSTRSSVHFPITCYNLQTNQQRFDSRGVTDIQYC